MASSSEIVNAATTNGLDLHTTMPPYIQFVSWSCNWAFLYPESALRILPVTRGLNYIEITE